MEKKRTDGQKRDLRRGKAVQISPWVKTVLFKLRFLRSANVIVVVATALVMVEIEERREPTTRRECPMSLAQQG